MMKAPAVQSERQSPPKHRATQSIVKLDTATLPEGGRLEQQIGRKVDVLLTNNASLSGVLGAVLSFPPPGQIKLLTPDGEERFLKLREVALLEFDPPAQRGATAPSEPKTASRSKGPSASDPGLLEIKTRDGFRYGFSENQFVVSSDLFFWGEDRQGKGPKGEADVVCISKGTVVRLVQILTDPRKFEPGSLPRYREGENAMGHETPDGWVVVSQRNDGTDLRGVPRRLLRPLAA